MCIRDSGERGRGDAPVEPRVRSLELCERNLERGASARLGALATRGELRGAARLVELIDLEHVKDHKLPKLENVEPEDDVDSEDDVEYFIDPEDPEDREFVLREKLANLLKPLAAHNPDKAIKAVWRKRAQQAASEITTYLGAQNHHGVSIRKLEKLYGKLSTSSTEPGLKK